MSGTARTPFEHPAEIEEVRKVIERNCPMPLSTLIEEIERGFYERGVSYQGGDILATLRLLASYFTVYPH